MLTDITLGQFFPGNSIIHKLDPRTKIITTIAFISTIFLAQDYVSYTIVIAYSLIVFSLSKLPPKLILRSLKPLWMIIVLTLAIHIFSGTGTVIYSMGPLSITSEGLKQGVMMSTRLVILILMSSLLTYTTSPIILTDGIEHLLNPFKKIGVPAHELAMMMTIALRFIPTLLEETDRIMKAQMSRGADFSSGGIMKRAKSLIPLLVPLFISAFRRADELAVAMEARCYRGGENRTRMRELAMTERDAAAFISVIALIILLLYIRWISV